jgi:serine/threonine protein kinase
MWTPSAEIWSLGAVIWNIMTKIPPQLEEVKRGSKTFLEHSCNPLAMGNYFLPLREVLSTFLNPNPMERPTSVELVHKVARAKDILADRLGGNSEDLKKSAKKARMPKTFGGDLISLMKGPLEPRRIEYSR